MKLPSRIRIKHNVSYEVCFVTEFDDDETLGECRPSTRQIVIKTGMSNRETIKTLIHEVTHALFDENDIGIPHKNVHLLEHAVYRLLKLNKWME